MTKLDELKNYMAELFAAATDKTTIEKAAIVNKKMEEVEQEVVKKDEDYHKLLNDYKEVILHTSFKPGEADNQSGVPATFDADAAFNKFFGGK